MFPLKNLACKGLNNAYMSQTSMLGITSPEEIKENIIRYKERYKSGYQMWQKSSLDVTYQKKFLNWQNIVHDDIPHIPFI